MSKNVLYVYHGEGADENSRDQLFSSLKKSVCPQKHCVKYITPGDILRGKLNYLLVPALTFRGDVHDLLTMFSSKHGQLMVHSSPDQIGKWVKDAALLAIGGGYDLGLIRALGDDGIALIRKYVGEGGSYLGVCSGGYFACDYIEFDKGGPLEVCGERHLKFFPGLGMGPVFPGFQYKTFKGAIATSTDYWDEEFNQVFSFHTYFNGGSFFKIYEHMMNKTTDPVQNKTHQNVTTSMTNGNHEPHLLQNSSENAKGDNSISDSFTAHHIEILAKYSCLEEEPVAIVKTKFGSGLSVLSGVHIEYSVDALPEGDPYVDNMLDNLKKGEITRKQCFASLLKQLNISCKDGCF